SEVQDMITVGWSVNEAVAAAVGVGHSLAGRDCVVTMKIPGLFQAGDIFTSGALFSQERGALIYYIPSDFVPSSTQHTIDPRYLFKSCFIPVFEPRNHQELHESAAIAVEVSRRYHTQVVIMPNGNLCHSEGLVHLMPHQQREPVNMPERLNLFNVFPGMARKNYDDVLSTRMPALLEMVENSPLNRLVKGSGKMGVITYGICDTYVREIRQTLGQDFDILSLAFTNPLPMKLIEDFCKSINGDVYVVEDGYRFVQEAMLQAGLQVKGKEVYETITEWTPALIAARLGYDLPKAGSSITPPARPPVICAGCPYRLIAKEIALLRKRGQINTVFGDIGCNALLYFMNALDTGLAMGASEAQRIGYVLSRPDQAAHCISLLGDSTECHSGMDATRNTVYRNVPGIKIILDNSWTGMTGGQPTPTSPANLAGQSMRFNLPAALRGHGVDVIEVGAYQKENIRKALNQAISEADQGHFVTIVVQDGSCIQKVKPSTQRVMVDAEVCKKCGMCLICPGLETDESKVPHVTNLCSGCGGSTPACTQMCPTKVLHAVDIKDLPQNVRPDFGVPPELTAEVNPAALRLPERLSLAIRGVGGQGNLFFGHVLSQLAFLAGYDRQNIVKGETHGMAQMGGPVISTFSCGQVLSPVLLPGSADCLIAMERSEVFRSGFLDMLKPGGTIVLAKTRIIPAGLSEADYPLEEKIQAALSDYHVVEVDALGIALKLGDTSGRSANVVMMGVLSCLPPFNTIPAAFWLKALNKANARPAVWAVNHAAFSAGREVLA
ncbi:MAG: 2-oxoacid:acceptor oxidoreductase family protein, partial [Anaerolineae bacterium]|nr:2-oxoacid:acceptor oxidoreductase family protein [Anaerolineae bacterium]